MDSERADIGVSAAEVSRAGRSELLVYSDLPRSDLPALRAQLSAMPDAERERLVRSLVELAELNVDVNFHRVFREALSDRNPRVRQLGVEGLWEDEGSDLPERYLELLKGDPDQDVRAEAAAALQRYAEEVAVSIESAECRRLADDLTRIAQDASEPSLVRRRCIESSGALAADSRVRQLIRDALGDDDQTIAAGALRAMGLSRQSQWLPDLERAMQSMDAELRFEAANAAGLLGEPQLVEVLARLVADEDPEVQSAAVSALGKIGGTGATRVLRRLRESGLIEYGDLVDEALEEAMLEDPLANG